MQNRSSRGKPKFTPGMIAGAALAVLAIALAYFAQFVWFPDGVSVTTSDTQGENHDVSAIAATSVVRINEIMSSNSSAFTDETGAYPDYVELINSGNESVDLFGLILTDKLTSSTQFTFPNHTLAPGETVIVFCDDGASNTYGRPYHAPFKISASGDTIMLCNSAGGVIESVAVPAMSQNKVYMRDASGEWAISGEYTPGMANTSANHALLTDARQVAQSDLEITEFMADNATYAQAANGLFYDYIEIHNAGNSSVNLLGYALSDDENEPTKWRFPDVTIGAGEYLVIYASGLDKYESGELHANFKLSAEGERVILANPQGMFIENVAFDNLKTDQAYSKDPNSGEWTLNKSPTPGMANNSQSAAIIEAGFAARSGLYINELAATTNELDYDWIEIYNSTGAPIDISGYGLSDDPSHPRKWQFPSGFTIGAGEYLGVYCSGLDKTDSGFAHTNFRISATGGEEITLSTPEGEIISRAPVLQQYSNMSYGRVYGSDGYFYFTTPTPRAANSMTGYRERAVTPIISVAGGIFDAGESFTVEISCPPGSRVYYTTDCSDPDSNSIVYTGPIQVSGTTIIRAATVTDGCLDSLPATQSYLFGISHSMRVVSLVSDPDNLFSDERGICVMGPNATSTYPYGSMGRGANFWMDWERDAHVEVFTRDGETLLSQGCGIKLHGQYSRPNDQKAFKVIARAQYGASTFEAPLFTNRDYTEYQSFLLRASGQDCEYTHMRDSIITSLAADTNVMYQETELCVVYLNGEYWGQYNMRERVNAYSIAQWEGWTSSTEAIDIVKANTNVMQGSNETFEALREWVKANGIDTDEKLAYVAQRLDIDEYLDYVIIQMYCGNTDLLNVKKYRSSLEDGKWRFILFDTDGGFWNNTNSVSRWLNPAGAGRDQLTYNVILRALLKNPTVRDKFLTRFGELMLKWNSEYMLQKLDERYLALKDEMVANYSKWKNNSTWEKEVKKLRDWVFKRQYYMFTDGYIQKMYGDDSSDDLTADEMERYFGEAMALEKAFEERAANGEISTELPN